jgi:SAM-dependent methyltransferase
MQEPARFSGTIQYIYAHWLSFSLVYGGIVVALLVIGISLDRGWLGFVPMATAVLLLLSYFFLAASWRGYQLFDQRGLRPHIALFEMGALDPEDDLVYIDLGLRQRPLNLCRRLTTGHLTVVDIYNPQWMPDRSLTRWRNRWPHPPQDPRLSWRDGQFNLLPLPDESVTAVILCQITSELWLHGDRLVLLREVFRILQPDGRLLFAEPCRNQIAWLTLGLGAWGLETAVYWRNLLTEAGFRIRREQELNGYIHCIRAHKPTPTEAKQLAFDLKI